MRKIIITCMIFFAVSIWALECFVAGTPVTMADGSQKPIEQVTFDDSVLTFNLQTRTVEPKHVRITETTYHTGDGDDFLIKIHLSDGTVLFGTNNHPIYVEGKGWCAYSPYRSSIKNGGPVLQLALGDHLIRLIALSHVDNVTVTSIEKILAGYRTYNLTEVEGNHDFFANGILVHNGYDPPPPPPPDTCCFVAGTQITMADSSQESIEEVKAGEFVKTYDDVTKTVGVNKVSEVVRVFHSGKGDDYTVRIEFSDGTVNQNTNSHPYWVEGKGYASFRPDITKAQYNLSVAQLELGDSVLKLAKDKISLITIRSITIERDEVWTYNLKKVLGNHNFFANGILVHNKSGDGDGGTGGDPTDSAAAQAGSDETAAAGDISSSSGYAGASSGDLSSAQSASDIAFDDLGGIASSSQLASDCTALFSGLDDQAGFGLVSSQDALKTASVVAAQAGLANNNSVEAANKAWVDATAKVLNDPANLANGANEISKIDLAYKYLGHDIRVQRYYSSVDGRNTSFGIGWQFNYDSHVVFGVNLQYAEKFQAMRNAVSTVTKNYQQLFDPANGLYKKAQEAAETAVAEASHAVELAGGTDGLGASAGALYEANRAVALCNDAIAKAQAALAAASSAKQSANAAVAIFGNLIELYPTYVNVRHVLAIQAQANQAYAAAAQTLNAAQNALPLGYTEPNQSDPPDTSSISGVWTAATRALAAAKEILASAQSNLARLQAEIIQSKQDMDAIVTELNDDLLEAQEETNLSMSNMARNREVLDPGHPEDQLFSNGYVKLVDRAGFSHLYKLDAAPDYSSTTSFPDGSVNYYPQGSSLSPVTAHDTTLRLNPDGSLTATEKDQTVLSYDYSGYLQSIVDRNGNVITLNRSGRQLNSIADGFGRKTTLIWAGGHIASITDPLNNVYSYSYLGDYLATETDPAGNTYGYKYANGVIVRKTTPDGGFTDYQYSVDMLGKLWYTKATDTRGNDWTFVYHPDQGYTVTMNRRGEVETYHYDANSLVVETDNSDGSVILSVYDPNRNLISQTDESGGVTTYSYDAHRNVVSITAPDESTRRFVYDDANGLTSSTDGNGNLTSYSYDSHGNLLEVVKPDGTHETFAYNSQGLAVSHTDANGNTTKSEYDQNGYVSQITYPDGGSAKKSCDVLGRVLVATDEVGALTSYVYNPLGQVTSVRDALGRTTAYDYTGTGAVKTVTDPNGNVTSYSYDSNKNLNMIQNALGAQRQFSYTAEDQLEGLVLPDGSTYSYRYDNRGRLVQTNQNELGIGYAYAYDRHGNLTSKTDPLGNTWSYQYDASNRLMKAIDPAGSITQYIHDANGNVVSKIDAAGRESRYVYDSMNRMVSFTDALGNQTVYTYDKNGNFVQKIDANRKVYKLTYDSRNRLVSATDPAGYSIFYTYDAASCLIQKTDARGSVTKYSYDPLGRLRQTTDPLGATVKYAYDANGNRISATDQRGNTTSFVYDGLNRLVKTVNPYGKAISLSYDTMGRVIVQTDALGGTKKYSYDAMGRKLTETNELNKTTSFGYDKDGHLLTVTDPIGHLTSFAYDSLGRLASRTDTLGNTQSFVYDALGNLVAVTDAKGKTYQYCYDELSRLVAEINKAGAKQSYGYDPVGNLISKIDFNGLASQYLYDEAYRLSEVDFSDGKKKSFTYDSNGNLLSASNEATALSFQYDQDNRLKAATDGKLEQSESFSYDPSGNRVATTWLDGRRTISYSYGKMNELLTVTDPEQGKTSFTYDDLERVVAELQPDGITTSTSYDAASRVSSIVYKGQHGLGNNGRLLSRAYLYNDANQRTFEVDSNGQITGYSYDADGQLIQVEYPFVSDKKSVDFKERLDLGLAPAYLASKQRRGPQLTSINFPRGIEGFDQNDFAQSLEDLVTKNEGLYKALQKIDPKAQGNWNITPGAGATPFTQRLGPDGATSQALQNAYQSVAGWSRYFDPNEYVWTESFSYDPNGNRTAKANGWGSATYGYSDDDRMLTAGNRTYTYDPNGNTTSEAVGDLTTSFSYSDENRLIDAYRSVTADAAKNYSLTIREGVSYNYDALGRRSESSTYTAFDQDWAKHLVRQWKTETDKNYLYDGQSLDPLAAFIDTDFSRTGWKDFDPWGHRGRNMAALSELIRGNGKILERNSFSDRSYGWNSVNPSDIDYFLTNEQGSVTAILGMNGKVGEEYVYDAFGATIAGDLGLANDIGYNGKIYDPIVHLYNFGYRDYAPRVGRFTTTDPIHAGANWFVYCGNDPINFTDPLGLMWPDASGNSGTSDDTSPAGKAFDATSTLASVTARDYKNNAGSLFAEGSQTFWGGSAPL